MGDTGFEEDYRLQMHSRRSGTYSLVLSVQQKEQHNIIQYSRLKITTPSVLCLTFKQSVTN